MSQLESFSHSKAPRNTCSTTWFGDHLTKQFTLQQTMDVLLCSMSNQVILLRRNSFTQKVKSSSSLWRTISQCLSQAQEMALQKCAALKPLKKSEFSNTAQSLAVVQQLVHFSMIVSTRNFTSYRLADKKPVMSL